MSATLDDVLSVLREIATAAKPVSATVNREELADLLGIGTTNLDTMRAMGRIGPKPAKFGSSVRWVRSEILDWLSRRHPDGELLTSDEWAAILRQHR